MWRKETPIPSISSDPSLSACKVATFYHHFWSVPDLFRRVHGMLHLVAVKVNMSYISHKCCSCCIFVLSSFPTVLFPCS